MFRGNVSPVQGSKARAIVSSAGTEKGRHKKGLLCEYVRSQTRPCFFCSSLALLLL
jgi:hypothetical protein